jgi:hypothetical protein
MDGDKEIALFFGNVDVKVSDETRAEFLLRWFFSLNPGSAGDAMTL